MRRFAKSIMNFHLRLHGPLRRPALRHTQELSVKKFEGLPNQNEIAEDDVSREEKRLAALSQAIQASLIAILEIPREDFFQIVHELPSGRFRHTPSFLRIKYSNDLVFLET
jgi:hypothetical protein